jgi:Arc/MetJ-type ribon-helix-helix transcriptional regulator
MIELSQETETLLRDLIEDGECISENEFIFAALKLLQECDDRARIAELRRKIAIGIEEADRGEPGPFDPRATLQRVRMRRANTEGSF